MFGSEANMDAIFESIKTLASSQVAEFIKKNFGSADKFSSVVTVLQAAGKLDKNSISQWPQELQKLAGGSGLAGTLGSLVGGFFKKKA